MNGYAMSSISQGSSLFPYILSTPSPVMFPEPWQI